MELVQPGRRVWLHFLLLLSTLGTTTIVGARFYHSFTQGTEQRIVFFALPLHILSGLWFSIPLLLILGVHEWGHLEAARRYQISASLPYFVPAPTLIGTMGAFIRIKSPFYTRRALFDVGIWGPFAGFIVALPVLVAGLAMSRHREGIYVDGSMSFGHPPLLLLLNLVLNPGSDEFSLLLHPVARAAWVGLFATAMNLIPGGQLDGGHILYALSPKWHKGVSLTIGILLGLPMLVLVACWGLERMYPLAGPIGDWIDELYWPGWFFWSVILIVLGRRHPPVYDLEPIDAGRRRQAIAALAVFLLCFTPVPFRIF